MLFIIGLVMAVILMATGVYSFSLGSIKTGAVLSLIAVVTITLSTMFVVIPPRTVGVFVNFGKTAGVASSGISFKAPWIRVEKFDGSIQNDTYNAENSIPVRLGNSSIARADISVRWQMKLESAEELFLDYKDFNGIRSNLVDRELRAALNEVMAEYNPLSAENIGSEDSGSKLSELSEKTAEKLRDKVGTKIEIHSVTIPLIQFDEQTQQRVDELQSEIARTRVAEQREKTAKAEARANRELEQGISEQVLISKCLDIVEQNGQSPLGCFPGSTSGLMMNMSKE